MVQLLTGLLPHLALDFLPLPVHVLLGLPVGVYLRPGISLPGGAQRDPGIAGGQDIRLELHKGIGGVIAVWRADQQGHAPHPEVLDAVLPTKVYCLHGDALLRGQTGGGYGCLGLGQQIGHHRDVVPADVAVDPTIGGNAGPAVYRQAVLDQIVRQVAVCDIGNGQAVLAHRQNRGVYLRAVPLTDDIQQISRILHPLGIGQGQVCVVVQIIALRLVTDQQMPAQRRLG